MKSRRHRRRARTLVAVASAAALSIGAGANAFAAVRQQFFEASGQLHVALARTRLRRRLDCAATRAATNRWVGDPSSSSTTTANRIAVAAAAGAAVAAVVSATTSGEKSAGASSSSSSEPAPKKKKKKSVLQLPSAMGILYSVSDLPRTEALGIELRATSALAAPVSMMDGSLLEEPFRIRFQLDGTPEENQKVVADTLKAIDKHFKWQGACGCSFTCQVAKRLGVEPDGVGKEIGPGNEVREMLKKMLKGQVSFFHSVLHTDAAGYDELVWGKNASDDCWREKVVLICTLGMALGATLFKDGHRVQHPLIGDRDVLNMVYPLEVAVGEDGKFTPPRTGSPEFDGWAGSVDGHLCELVEAVGHVDRVIVIPTGRTASCFERIRDKLEPRLVHLSEMAKSSGFEVMLSEQAEGAIVKGVALSSLVELQGQQAYKSFESVLQGSPSLQDLSDAQLHALYERLDDDADGKLEVSELVQALQSMGMHYDMDMLADELDSDHEGVIVFDDFSKWWYKHVQDADIVTITSAAAWRSIIERPPPEDHSSLVILEVAFTFCRTCKQFDPKLKMLAKRHPTVSFVKIVGNGTIGAMDFCANILGVKASPSFFVFRRGPDGGELLDTWQGANLERFEEHLGSCEDLETSS